MGNNKCTLSEGEKPSETSTGFEKGAPANWRARARTYVQENACRIGVLMVGISFLAVVVRCLILHAPDDPGYGVMYCLPGAISRVAFDHHPRYTTRADVANQLEAALKNRNNGDAAFGQGSHRTAAVINAAILDVLQNVDATKKSDAWLLYDDDKGIVDLVIACFWVVGYKVQYVTYAILLLLFLSCAAFVAAFFRSSACLFFLVAYLAGFYLLIPFVILNPQLQSLLAPRVFPIFSMVACLHCILYALRPSFRRMAIGLCILQALFICLIVHIRTSGLWQVGIIAVVSGVILLKAIGLYGSVLWRHVQERQWAPLCRCVGGTLPAAVLVTSLLGLQAYRYLVYPKAYHRGDRMLTRPFWHNIYMGFAFSPYFSERDGLRIDDHSEFMATGKYLIELGREEEWRAMGGMNVNEHGDLVAMNWTLYDRVVRERLIRECWRHPGHVAAAVAFYKPAAVIEHFSWMIGGRKLPPHLERFWSHSGDRGVEVQFMVMSSRLDQQRLRAYPWHPMMLFLVLCGGLLWCLRSDTDAMPVGVGVAILVAGSFVPPLLCYPTPHNIAESFLGLAVGVFFLVVVPFKLIAARCGVAPYFPRENTPSVPVES